MSRWFLVVASVIVSACSSSSAPAPLSTAPSSVSSSPVPSPSPTLQGSIALTSITPSPGSALSVRDCASNPGYAGYCSYARITADVALEQTVSDAVVTAAFYRGTERCGIAHSAPTHLQGDTRTRFTITDISLSDEYTLLHCGPLPAETNRVVVQVWSASRPAVPLFSQEFAYSYRFMIP